MKKLIKGIEIVGRFYNTLYTMRETKFNLVYCT